jgi:plastocyanin
MKITGLLFAAVSIGVSIAGAGCGRTDSEILSGPGNPTGKPVDAATAGSVRGTIRLEGASPKMKSINMAAVPNCAKQHATPAMTDSVVTADNGALQNVIVYLKGDFSQYSFDSAKSPVIIDQKGCVYNPHVLALMTGQQLEVTNSDQATHNVNAAPKINRRWNESQSPGGAPISESFARQEIGIPVKCNVHPWMKAYIAVFSNPYFQVTGEDGSFEISNVPPGTYTVTAWHEFYGTSQQTVSLGSGEAKTVAISFKAGKSTD